MPAPKGAKLWTLASPTMSPPRFHGRQILKKHPNFGGEKSGKSPGYFGGKSRLVITVYDNLTRCIKVVAIYLPYKSIKM